MAAVTGSSSPNQIAFRKVVSGTVENMPKPMAYGRAKETASRMAVPQSPLDAGLAQIPPGWGPGESLKAVKSRGTGPLPAAAASIHSSTRQIPGSIR